DVDLLLVQLVHHRTHPLPHRPNARALRADIRIVADNRDLAAMTGLSCHGFDLDRPISDLRYLELEQLLNQPWMGPRDDHLRAAEFLAHRDHIDTDPSSVRVKLTWHLFGQRHDGLDLAKINEHGTAVTALLYDSGDDVALDPGEMAVLLLVFGISQPLHD